MAFAKKIHLGDLVVEKKLITEDQLQLAIIEQKKLGRNLGSTLVELGMIDENTLLNLVSSQLGIPLIDFNNYHYSDDVAKLLPEVIARRYRAIVLEDRGKDYLVGMVDPTDIYALDEIQSKLSKPVSQAIVRETALLENFDLIYRRTEEISALAEELGQDLSESGVNLDDLLQVEMTDAPVAKLLRSIFEDAVQIGASDIHIEPDKNVIRIRQRIDGILYEQVMQETQIAPAVVVRLKLMANLNISEKRLPQDGRFNMIVKKRDIDVRISTMPVQYGESVVMRILDQTRGALDIEKLGDRLAKRSLKRIGQGGLHRPFRRKRKGEVLSGEIAAHNFIEVSSSRLVIPQVNIAVAQTIALGHQQCVTGDVFHRRSGQDETINLRQRLHFLK